EPWALGNLFDAAPQLSAPFSTYGNLVYAPHTYTHVFTVDRTVLGSSPAPVPYPASYDQAFQTAEIEATALNAALFVGEFGNGSDQDDTILRAETDAQDRHLTGSTVWEWKNTCGAGSVCADSWGTYASDPSQPPAQNGPLKASRVKFLSRIVPRATVGRLVSFAYHPDDRSFAMNADAPADTLQSTRGALTDVYIPAIASGSVSAGGGASLDHVTTNPDGSRDAFVAATGGAYLVTVGPSVA